MKNDKFPDWLPPALVKDWRQMLRSPLYLLGVLAVALVGVLVVLRSANGEEAFLSLLSMLGVLVCGLVPARVSMAVSAEVGNTGGNFMRLTPLSSRQVVWGTWLSGVVQVALFLSAALPIACLCIEEPPVACSTGCVLAYAAGFAILGATACVMVAAGQATAALSPLIRVFGGLLLMGWALSAARGMVDLVRNTDSAWVAWGGFMRLLLMCVVMTVTLLEEARRPYALPAENCSAAVRWSSLLVFAAYTCQIFLLPEDSHWLVYGWAVFFVLMMAVWDMLQPERVLSFAGRRSCRGGLPGALNEQGQWGGALWLSFVVALCLFAMLPLIQGWYSAVQEEPEIAGASSAWLMLLVCGRFWLSLLVALLAALLVCRLSVRQGTAIFCLLMLVELFLGFVFGAFEMLTSQITVWEFLPLLPTDFASLSRYFHADNGLRAVWENTLCFIGVKLVWLVALLLIFRFTGRRR